MRTPWRMIADLVSGKPSKNDAETKAQNHVADKDETTTPDHSHAEIAAVTKPEATSEITDGIAREPVVWEQSKGKLSEAVANETAMKADTTTPVEKASAIARPEPAPINLPQSETKSSEPSAKPLPVATRAPAKPEKPIAKRARATSPVIAEPANDVQVAKSAFEEMSALDQEIEELRRRLSDKLKLQNAQLRKLINRYDGR